MITRKQAAFWLALAILIRFVDAMTNMGFYAPDEWYQTAEYANLMQHGFMTAQFEAHLRNLSYPFLLRLPLGLAAAAAPGHPWLQIFAIKFFTGLMDAAVTGFFVRGLLSRTGPKPAWLATLIVASFVLPYTFFDWSVRTSCEHISALAMMGFTAVLWQERRTLCGDVLLGWLLVAVGAARYPSFLFSAGAGAAWLWQLEKQGLAATARQRVYALTAGLALGAATFGAADWVYFGRFWESFWMYTQYNVWTGLAAETFGKQGPSVYAWYIWDRFGTAIAPWGLAVLVGAAYNLPKQLKGGAAWAWGLALFVAGHLMVAHKEGRFIAPLLPFLIAAAAFSWTELAPALERRWASVSARQRRLAGVSCCALLVVNTVAGLEVLRGHLFKSRHEFFTATALAKEQHACALASLSEIPSAFLSWKAPGPLPSLPTAHLDLTADGLVPQDLAATLSWVGRPPSCSDQERVYFHVRHAEPFWVNRRCTALDLYEDRWLKTLARWAQGTVLYDCPASILQAFQPAMVEPLTTAWVPLRGFPDYGISGAAFLGLLPQLPPREVVR